MIYVVYASLFGIPPQLIKWVDIACVQLPVNAKGFFIFLMIIWYAEIENDCLQLSFAEALAQGSSVQDELRNVASITGSLSAFAALRLDGSAVCWGDAECGGDAGA